MNEVPQPGFRPAEDVPGPAPTGMDPFEDPNETEPTEEEDRQYQQVVLRAMQFLASQKSAGSLVKAMNNPRLKVSQNVGRLAARLAIMIKQEAEAAGTEIDGVVMREAFGKEIIPKIFEMGEAAGIWDLKPQEEEQELNDSVLEATRFYGNMMKAQGKLPQAEAQEFLQSQGANIDPLVEEARPTPMAAGVKQANQQMANIY